MNCACIFHLFNCSFCYILEPSTVHLSRWSPDNHDEDFPISTLSCAPTEARGLFWNWTRAGHVALHRCPAGGMGKSV